MGKERGPLALATYVVVRVIIALFGMFPVEWNLRTARCMGNLWWWLMPRHRRRALQNLERAYGDALPEVERVRLAHASFQHLCMLAVESMQMHRLIQLTTWPRFLELDRFEPALDLLIQQKGLILLTGHFGNWELVGCFLSTLGFDVTAVMRPLNNAFLNRYLVALRGQKGLKLLAKKEVAEESEAVLRSGGVLGFIADQDAGRKGLFVPFFGQAASTYKSIGLLAMASECPIVVGYCRRIGTGFRYQIGAQGIIHPSEWASQPDPLRWITARYTALLEEAIRLAPEQYLWHHRRWKTQPGETVRKKKRDVPSTVPTASSP